MKKIMIFVLIFSVLFCLWYLFKNDKSGKEPFSDMPSMQEQQAIEESQVLPESIPENEMEYLSPENAEHS